MGVDGDAKAKAAKHIRRPFRMRVESELEIPLGRGHDANFLSRVRKLSCMASLLLCALSMLRLRAIDAGPAPPSTSPDRSRSTSDVRRRLEIGSDVICSIDDRSSHVMLSLALLVFPTLSASEVTLKSAIESLVELRFEVRPPPLAVGVRDENSPCAVSTALSKESLPE